MPSLRGMQLGVPTIDVATQSYTERLLITQPFALWPLSETSGSQITDVIGGFHGTNNNVTLNATTFPDGSPAPLFTGSTSRISLPATDLDVPFDPTLGALGCWLRVREPGVWTDGVIRSPFSAGADASNRVFATKGSTNNQFEQSYRASSVVEIRVNNPFNPAGWFHWMIVWDKANDLVEFWLNGDLVATSTGLGNWSGTLATAFTAIGNFTSAGGANFWDGYVKYAALWNRRPEPEEIASLVPAGFLA